MPPLQQTADTGLSMSDLIAAALAEKTRGGTKTWFSKCPAEVQEWLVANVAKPYWASPLKPLSTVLHDIARQAVLDKFGVDYLALDRQTFSRWLKNQQT